MDKIEKMKLKLSWRSTRIPALWIALERRNSRDDEEREEKCSVRPKVLRDCFLDDEIRNKAGYPLYVVPTLSTSP